MKNSFYLILNVFIPEQDDKMIVQAEERPRLGSQPGDLTHASNVGM